MLPVMLSLLLTTYGLQITVTAPQGCRPCYIQVDQGEPAIFQFDLDPGQSFGGTVNVAPLSSSVRVRVWTETSGTDADVDQVIALPAPHRTYLPLL